MLLLCLPGCARPRAVLPVDRTAELRAETLPAPYARLVPEAIPLGEPVAGSWRSGHDERGQSLAEYRALRRAQPARPGRILEVASLGRPGAAQARVIQRAGDYLAACYGLDVRTGPMIDPRSIPAAKRRESRGFGPQVESRYVLDSILVARRPADALASIALSTLDLYPAPDWNFVFGQAAPVQGVGVWSMARYGNPAESPDMEVVVLSRTLRTASHEVGHLLGLSHCITWHCLMNGSNSLDELDARPLELCPACLAKACEDRAVDPVARADRVAAVLEAAELRVDAAGFRRTGRLLRGSP